MQADELSKGKELARFRDGECDVCVWAHKDHSIKKTKFCRWCDAWICFDCWFRWDKRAWAAFKRWKDANAE